MSDDSKTPDPALVRFKEEPWRFEFSQALRVLLRNSDHGMSARRSDRRFDLEREPVRIEANPSLGFPASDIQSFTPNEKGKPRMRVNFLGLTGPSAVLPHPYTEFLIERDLAGDAGPAAFLDVFNHRMALLFYFAWEKYRAPVSSERRVDHDLFRQILLSLAGLGTEHLFAQRYALPPDFFVKYASLLSMQTRSAAALRGILRDYFKVKVEIEQFAGTWYALDENSQTRFRDEETDSQRVGYGVVAGDEYWSQESKVRLRIGPMKLATFRTFLPGSRNYELLMEICRFFSRDEIAFEAQLVLDKKSIPMTRLGNKKPEDEAAGAGPRLGFTTWAKSKNFKFKKHAKEVVIQLC